MAHRNRNWVAFLLLIALAPVLLNLWVPLVISQEDVAGRASVRLASGGGCTMIDTDGKTSYGVTAAHCVGNVGSKVEVVLGDKTVTGKVLSRDTEHDLALISVAAKVRHLAPVATRPLHAKVFYTVNERGKFELTVKHEGEQRWDMVNRRLLHRRIFTVIQGNCWPGDSGTGVFQDGKLVGVVTHGVRDTDSKLLMSPTQPTLVWFMATSQQIVPLKGDYRSWGEPPVIPQPGVRLASSTRKTPAVLEFENGNYYSKWEKWDVAILCYTEAIRLNPEYAEAYYNRGAAYHEQGKPDKAITDYSDAIRWSPSVAAYVRRAVMYQIQGEQAKADADFARARDLTAKK